MPINHEEKEEESGKIFRLVVYILTTIMSSGVSLSHNLTESRATVLYFLYP